MFNRILLNYDSVKLLLYKHLRKSSAYIFISSWVFISYSSDNICQSFGSWYYADSLNSRRLHHSSIMLSNGNILVMGGVSDSGETASCEIYDKSTATWRYTNPMLFPRRYHKSILLNNGKILVRGGYYLTQCEIFDPQTEIWSSTGQAKQARFEGFTMNRLNNGEILVAGGLHGQSIFNSCELYNLDSGYWKFTGSMNTERHGHSATLMNDGRILVVGGYGSRRYLKSVEIYDPISQSWMFTDSLNEERGNHSANLLPSGKILIAGGQNFINNSVNFLNSCELFDPVSQTWETVGSMVIRRFQHNALQVSDSVILFTGGGFAPQYWELYNFREFMVVFTSTLNEQIYLPSSILLQSGNVINIGGAFFDMGLGPLPVCLIYNKAIVPIELTSFKLKNIDNCTSLFWETATELNNKGFEIQRKMDNKVWEIVAFIEGKGTTTNKVNYIYTDENL